MAFKYHDVLSTGDIHIPHDLEYANQTARLAGSGLGSQHVGRLCKQLDDGSYWVLTQFTPTIEWAPFVPPEPVVGDIGKDLRIASDGSGGVKLVWSADALTTLDDAYNNSGGPSTIIVDSGDIAFSLSGTNSVVVDASSATGSDGLEVINGSDNFRVVYGAANELNLSAALASVNLSSSANFNITHFGEFSLYPNGAKSVNIDFTSVTGTDDGFRILNGADFFEFKHLAADSMTLLGNIVTFNIDCSSSIIMSSTSACSIDSSELNLKSTPKITTNAAQNLNLVPGTGGITQAGSGSTSHSLISNQDLFVSGQFEADGNSFFDGELTVAAAATFNNSVRLGDANVLRLGAAGDVDIQWNTVQTNDALSIGLGASNVVMLMRKADDGTDIGLSNQTNPTFFVLSANIVSDTTEWISLVHNQTDGVITCGKGNLRLFPAENGFTQLGSGTSAHSLDANEDLFVPGELEVGGKLWADGSIECNATLLMGDNDQIQFGSSSDAVLAWVTAQTPDTLLFGLNDSSKSIVFCEKADIGYDFQHAAQTNPTIFIHSANQSTIRWLSLTHDQSSGLISTGEGNLKFLPASGYITQVGDAGSTSHGLAANDDFFVSGQLEVDGGIFSDNNIVLDSNKLLYSDTGMGAIQPKNTSQTVDCFGFYPGPTGNYFLICEYTDRNYDFQHAAQTNPTVFIHSANQSTTEWISLTHNQTNGVIGVGAGAIKLDASAIVEGSLLLDELGAAPGATTGYGKLFVKSSDTNLYFLKSGGSEVKISNGAGTPNVGFYAYRITSTQSLNNLTETKIQFNTDENDDGSDYDATTNYRFTAPTTGRYTFQAGAYVTLAAAGSCELRIYVNSTEMRRGESRVATAGNVYPTVGGTFKLTASDTVEIRAYQSSGFTASIQASRLTSFDGAQVSEV